MGAHNMKIIHYTHKTTHNKYNKSVVLTLFCSMHANIIREIHFDGGTRRWGRPMTLNALTHQVSSSYV